MAHDRFLLVWDRFGDYHRARWRALQARVGQQNVVAADLGGADDKYKWESTDADDQYVLLSEKSVEEDDDARRLANYTRCLDDFGITVVCVGYGRPIYRKFARIARKRGLRVIIFSESWYPRNFLFDLLKGISLRRLGDGFLLSGQRASRHFSGRLGVPADRIRCGYDCVDNAHFARPAAAPPREKIVLCVARFAPVKNLLGLIEAFLASELAVDWHLRLVGDGPQREELEAIAARHPNISLSQWLTYAELPGCYHAASLLVLPSTFEPWGLVVNEGAAAGLPLIVSEETGAVTDLVTPDNGATFPATDTDRLTGIFNRYAALDADVLQQQGETSQRLVSRFSPEHWAAAVLELA